MSVNANTRLRSPLSKQSDVEALESLRLDPDALAICTVFCLRPLHSFGASSTAQKSHEYPEVSTGAECLYEGATNTHRLFLAAPGPEASRGIDHEDDTGAFCQLVIANSASDSSAMSIDRTTAACRNFRCGRSEKVSRIDPTHPTGPYVPAILADQTHHR